MGTTFMFGATLIGRKTTSVSRNCKGESITTVIESWTDPQTNVEVLRKMSSPNRPTGEFTMTMQNYSNAEPDSALFLVPSDYEVVDESGPFTIEVSRKKTGTVNRTSSPTAKWCSNFLLACEEVI
jgi:hypothetical protein